MYKKKVRLDVIDILTITIVAVYLVLSILSRDPFYINTNLLMIFGQFNYFVIRYHWYWQLFTSMFVHANILHIFFNAFFLYLIGKRMEHITSWEYTMSVFILSGLVGNFFSLLSGPFVVSVGASGGILGLYSAYVVILNKLSNQPLKSTLTSLFIVFILNSFMPDVDILAHLGGIIGGAVLGYLYIKRKVRYRVSYRYLYKY